MTTGKLLALCCLALAGVVADDSGEPQPTTGAESASAQAARASGAAEGKASARTRGRCSRRVSTRERRDCRDLRLGKPENPTRQPYDGKRIRTPNARRCDFLDPAVCLQPWPNDYFTVADRSTTTGRRVRLALPSMPANVAGRHIDPTDHNRADGFSPGQLIVTKVPGLTTPAALRKTDPVSLTDLHAFADPKTPIVVIDAASGKRQPIWVELDATATAPRNVNLLIRPAINFEEGHRYIVALRRVRTRADRLIRPATAFRVYRDRLITKQKPIERRRRKMERLFKRLQSAGIRRGNLYLAWDFTIASAGSIAGRVLAMRKDAFAELGDTDLDDLAVQGSAPGFTITGTEDFVPCGGDGCDPGESDDVLRVVDGRLEDVPCYLDTNGCVPGSRFAFAGPNSRLPSFNGSFSVDVPFRCLIPRSVISGADVIQARPLLYGHGVLGSRNEVVRFTGRLAAEHNFITCAANWTGISGEEILTTVYPALSDLSKFPSIADEVQQSLINLMYVGRAMIHPNGFNGNPAFAVDPDGGDPAPAEPVIDAGSLFYYGLSHGAVMGGALTALAPDFNRAVLAVGAMNHSTLLPRSVAFEPLFPILKASYPSELARPLILSMLQMLWDRAEGNGYAHHMTGDPYPNTPAHTVLMQVAFGDHSVTNYASEVQARTIGASIYQPALDPGRHWDSHPFLGIPAIPSFPFKGSAIVYWDGGPLGFAGTIGPGTAPPLAENVPPRSADGFGGDSHYYLNPDTQASEQASNFLRVGGSLEPCTGGGPCYMNGWTGPP
jgi:hypothetical protein